MSLLTALYTLIISPLELLFEVVFTIADRIIGNEGLAIIFLSLAVNFLVLPLYKRADELQAEERDIQAKMAARVKQIKHTFKGDERFFMLQEYYRINNYKPIYALKSSVSLLLQIPFFIAAYNLLSGMQSLRGMQFGFIKDLGAEDAVFMIGNFPVNILPILMTLINIVSGIIYTKGHPLKAKIQVYGLAAIFLVLLYHSPSGLVFYWLLNNVFSLVKNIFYKLKDPKKALKIVLAAAGLFVVAASLIRADLGIRQKIFLTAGGLLLCLPLVLGKFKNRIFKNKEISEKAASGFFPGAILMSLITGLLIPSTIIDASPMEFIDTVRHYNPSLYVLNACLLAFGSWVLWGGVFYFFMSGKNRVLFSRLVWICCGVSVVDYMLFGRNLGNLSSSLKFDETPAFSVAEIAVNVLAVAAVILVFGLVHSQKPKITKAVQIIAALAVALIGAYHMLGIITTYKIYIDVNASSEDNISIPLSKNGKNVVVIMLDRAMGTHVPYIFNEKPELLEQFDGFTYYPNTISYGTSTIFGSPALYGGYEYTPERINERSTESLESKHNEALKVMPVLFGDNGYTVTICDPSFAGYSWLPDLSIYDDHPEFNCYNTNGKFCIFDDDSNSTSLMLSARVHEMRNRNFYCFSLMKISPVIFQETIYNGGLYNEAYAGAGNEDSVYFDSLVQNRESLTSGFGYNMDFIWAYSVLAKLPEITYVDDSSNNTFMVMSNDTTHSECLLQEPDYVPAISVDNSAYDVDMAARYTVNGRTMLMQNDQQVTHYHVNMASYIVLGKWFDYLRENGVYDNTRIILVSDHGRYLRQFGVTCNGKDMECFMPLLMVKDFNATGFTVNEEFMTNGDTPVLATEGLIDNPLNPFTGKPLIMDYKSGPQTVFLSYDWDTGYNNGNTFLPGSWFTFTGTDPYDPASWEYQGDH